LDGNYRIARAKEERAEPALYAEPLDARVVRQPGKRVLEIEIQVTNRSDQKNSIVYAGLMLNYTKDASQLLLEIRSTASADENVDVFKIPSLIDSFGSHRGWVQFSIDDDLIADINVTKIGLLVRDTQMAEHVMQTIPLKGLL
jgi:hypothetical protein